MKQSILIFLAVFFSFSVSSQGLVNIENTGTCEDALDISRFKRFGPTTAPAPTEKGDAASFQYTKHPTWYTFTVPHDGILLFDIIPDKRSDNYDFLLFRSENGFCKKYKSGKAEPVRQNLNPSIGDDLGFTGLSMSPESPAYEEGLDVKKGEMFYLALNNMYDNGKGHTVVLNILETRKIYGKVTDKQNDNELKSELIWENLRKPDMRATTQTQKKGEYSMKIPLSTEPNAFPQYQLMAYADKYFPVINTYSTPEARELDNTEINIQLAKIKKGLNNDELGVIYFLPNEDKIEPESDIIFKKLLFLMKKNPKIAVTLEGHTNGLYPSTDVDMQLSAKRAIVVKEKLEENGISEDRIQIKGYGSTKTIFPIPEDEEQEGFNRRVEVFFDRF